MKYELKKNIGLALGSKNKLPSVVFKGHGVYADYLENEFKKHKPQSNIVSDTELLERLSKLPVGSDISPNLYHLIAILLVYVYTLLKKKQGDGIG